MARRVLLAFVCLLAASTAASAHKHRRAHATLALQAHTPTSDDGTKIDPATRTVLDVAPLANAAASFVEFHSARVENDLMMFKPTLIGITPAGPARNADLVAASPVKKKPTRFLAAALGGDVLEVRRDRDRLVLFRGPQPQGAAVGVGLAMFGATTILAAHAPRPLRVLFDGPVHLGPAIFDGGGMGAGIAGRGM